MFSKGRIFTLTDVKPWQYHIETALGSQSVSLVPVKKKTSEGDEEDTTEKHLGSSPLKEKYQAILKLDEKKLQDLRDLRPFLEDPGKIWLDQLFAEQSSADQPVASEDENSDTETDAVCHYDTVQEDAEVVRVT